MQIEIEYSTQVRTASGQSRQTLVVPDECSLADLLTALRTLHPSLAAWIDAEGQPRPGLLVFVNDQSPESAEFRLHANDVVALMTLVSGG